MQRHAGHSLPATPRRSTSPIALFAAVILGSCSTPTSLSFAAALHELEASALPLPDLEQLQALDDGGGPLLLVIDLPGALRWSVVERRRPRAMDEERLRADEEQIGAMEDSSADDDDEVVVTEESVVLPAAIEPAAPATERSEVPSAPPKVPEPAPDLGEPLHRGTVVRAVFLTVQMDGTIPHVRTGDGRTVSLGPSLDRQAIRDEIVVQRDAAASEGDVRAFDLACTPEVSLQLALDLLTIGLELGLDVPAPWCVRGPARLDAPTCAQLQAAVAHGGGAERRLAPWPWWTQTAREGEVLLAFAPSTSMARVHAVAAELCRRGIWRISFVGKAGSELGKLRANVRFFTGT